MQVFSRIALAVAGVLLFASASAQAQVTCSAPRDGVGGVIFTFDDGSRGQLAAAPYVPCATYFINPSYIGTDWYMNQGDLVTLRSYGAEIANHANTHVDLTTLSRAQVRDEVRTAQATIASMVGVRPTSFAVPFGAINPTINQVLKDEGYRVVALALEDCTFQSETATAPVQACRLDSQHGVGVMCDEIAEAAAGGYYLVLMWHELVEGNAGEYQNRIRDLRDVATCAQNLVAQGRLTVSTLNAVF